MDRLIRFTLRLSLIAATVAYVQTAAPTIQPHNGTLFLSHGSLIGGLSWGHIVLEVDLNQVNEELHNMTKLLVITKTAIQEIKETDMTSSMRTRVKYMQNEAERQAEKIIRVVRDAKDSFETKAGHVTRAKRQVAIAALAGMAVGGLVTSLFNQFNSQSLTNILNDKVNIIVSKVEHNNIEINQNSEDIKRLNQTMTFIRDELGKQIVVNKAIDLEFMVQLVVNLLNEAENRVERLLEALDQVFIGKFHRGLTNTEKLQNAMNSLRSQATNKGLLIGIQSLVELYQLPASFVYDATVSTVHVIVHVPLYREAHILSLYRYVSSPLQLPWDPELYLEIQPEKQFLGRNRDGTLTKTLSNLELQDCLSIGHAYFCDDNSLEKRALPSCLNSLFSGIHKSLLTECSGHITPKVATLQRLNKTSYMIAESTPLRIITECFVHGAVRTYSDTIPAGTHFMTVDAECTTTSEHWVISPSNTIQDVIVHAVHVPTVIDPQSFITGIDEDTLRLIGDTLKQVGQPISVSHVKGLTAFASAIAMKDWQFNMTKTIALPSMTTLLILAIGVTCYLLFRYTRRRQQPQPTDESAGHVNIQLQPLLTAEMHPGETPAPVPALRRPHTGEATTASASTQETATETDSPIQAPIFRFGTGFGPKC